MKHLYLKMESMWRKEKNVCNNCRKEQYNKCKYMMNSDAQGSHSTLSCSLKIEISRQIVKTTKLEKPKQQWKSDNRYQPENRPSIYLLA